MSRKPPKGKSLAEVNPELARQWHPTLNGNICPDSLSSNSHSKVWWKCPKGDDHEWQASPNGRSQGVSCPMCSGKIIVSSNCLSALNPSLALEFHPTKNIGLNTEQVGASGSKKVWWKCPEGDDHEWITSIDHRVRGSGCPICSGNKVVNSNCLQTLKPALAQEWHPFRNEELTPRMVTLGSSKKVWWKCPKGDDHEWEATLNTRSKGVGCPICSGNKIIDSNSLGFLNPILSKQWHPSKNKGLSPFQFSPNSGKKVWWKCPEGDDHEWEAIIGNRTRGHGCPVCANYLVVDSNNLRTVNAKLASEWHPTKNNGLQPEQYTKGSLKKVWWKCPKGDDHEWITSIRKRTDGRGCPYCTLTPQSKQELIITFELIKFFKDIDPKGLKTRIDGKVHSVDIYLPNINAGIEFDGSYWHKGKRELDKVKTLRLQKAGFNIIRIREEPLKKIFETDIISKQPYNGKEITDNLLKQIMTSYTLDKRTITKIEKYLLKDELQNQKALDKYIDQILTEKAEKIIKKH